MKPDSSVEVLTSFGQLLGSDIRVTFESPGSLRAEGCVATPHPICRRSEGLRYKPEKNSKMEEPIPELLQELYKRAAKEHDVEKLLEIASEIQRLRAEHKEDHKQPDPRSGKS